MLNVGVIGLGVGERHASAYQTISGCSLRVICDTDEAKLAEVSERFPGVGTSLYPELILNDPSIDVVSIASYDQYHAHQVTTALKNNKHVFVEKPLCLSQGELHDIAGLLTLKKNLKLCSNLILRKTPRFISLRQRIGAGEMGDIFYVEGDYDYGRMQKLTDGWRGTAPGYSVMHGGGIHIIDLICWLIGEKPVEVFAYGNNIASSKYNLKINDFEVALLKFSSGILAKVSANFGAVAPHHHKLSVYGSSATFEQSHMGAQYINSRNPGSIHDIVEDEYPGANKGDMTKSFIRHIQGDENVEINAKDVVDVMSISLAIQQSLLTGKPHSVSYLNV